MIIAKTVKGKGVSFMENQLSWHGKAQMMKNIKKQLMNWQKEKMKSKEKWRKEQMDKIAIRESFGKSIRRIRRRKTKTLLY